MTDNLTETIVQLGIFNLGARNDGSSSWNGLISFYRQYNRQLAAAEVIDTCVRPYAMFMPMRGIIPGPSAASSPGGRRRNVIIAREPHEHTTAGVGQD